MQGTKGGRFPFQLTQLAKKRGKVFANWETCLILSPLSALRRGVEVPEDAGIAQLVERYLAKVAVDGSSPFARSIFFFPCLIPCVHSYSDNATGSKPLFPIL